MIDTGECESKGCKQEHCPYSDKRCVFLTGYNRKCRIISSLVRTCSDYCKSIPWVICYCTSTEGNGGCLGIKDCEEY